jgi:hypothetical protein
MLPARYDRIAVVTVCIALGLIAFGPSSAYAAEAAKVPTSFEEFFKMHAMPAMHMIDTDNKGYVTKEEFMKFMEQFFDKMDKDHSGKVTAEEWIGQSSPRPRAPPTRPKRARQRGEAHRASSGSSWQGK